MVEKQVDMSLGVEEMKWKTWRVGNALLIWIWRWEAVTSVSDRGQCVSIALAVIQKAGI